jgi:L-seryl-tRNA(Ser) seleniumtransferase
MSASGNKLKETQAAHYAKLPSVDELLRRERLAALAAGAGRQLVLDAARIVLEGLREAIARKPEALAEELEPESIELQVMAEVQRALEPSLRPVINATGVVLHTNLGRTPLARAAMERVVRCAAQYSNLEYDLSERARGKRDAHTARLLMRLTGAEAAIVVNNCAAAVFLALNTLARGGEVIVSRGELIEIGDGFRIPDIMAASGARLCEVGTTNRTRIADYERAITPETRALLRVHRSNFRMVGFTERPSLEELLDLGRKRGLPVVEDLGSGNLADLAAAGVAEPQVRASVEAGVDLVLSSGDKLLGGPQAGIMAGKREFVQRARRNPLFRALRVDKLTIAALEATLLAHLRGALDEIPALRMIRMTPAEAERRAREFAARLRGALPSDAVEIELRAGESVIGGGSTPDQVLPATLIAISCARIPAAALHARLHAAAAGPPVVARVEEGRLLLDLRTVFPDQESDLAAALAAAVRC